MKIPAIRPLNFNKNSRSILKIEFDCYTDPWDEETFRDCFKQKHTRGLTVDLDGEIVGFIIYQINKNSITLVNVAVDKAHRRKGYAKELVNSVKSLLKKKGDKLDTVVSDVCLESHLFLKSQKFVVERVERKYFKVGDYYEDGYRFVYTRQEATMTPDEFEELVCRK